MTDIVSIRNQDYFKIADNFGCLSYGCNQEWYKSKWKRMAGCGPSVASNLLLYVHRSKDIDIPLNLNEKNDCIKLMESVWRHVTPTLKGVYLLKQFCGGVHSYTKAKGFELDSFSLNIPKKISERPSLSAMVEFIRKGLLSDAPVAFLNLSNGQVKNLDNWHWVTIVSLKTDELKNVSAQMYDGSESFEIDLKLWYETTSEGGGFVYFQ